MPISSAPARDSGFMACLAQMVVDCARPAAVARFWAVALNDFEVRARDLPEIERFAWLCLSDLNGVGTWFGASGVVGM